MSTSKSFVQIRRGGAPVPALLRVSSRDQSGATRCDIGATTGGLPLQELHKS
jgi:hypothetical protein